MSTPLEREILTHYWTRAVPYKEGSENWASADCEVVDKFIAMGLLIQKSDGEHNYIVANETALALYMEALAKVPYPELRWIIPE